MSIDAGVQGPLFFQGAQRKETGVIKLAVWAFIAYLGYRVFRNVSAVWKLMKNAPPPRQNPPRERRPVEAQFEVEEGK